jgi:hypothetical protein
VSSSARTVALAPAPAATAVRFATSAGWRSIWDFKETITVRKSDGDLSSDVWIVVIKEDLHLFWLRCAFENCPECAALDVALEDELEADNSVAGTGWFPGKTLKPSLNHAFPGTDAVHRRLRSVLVPGAFKWIDSLVGCQDMAVYW